MKTCTAKDCDRDVHAKGHCLKHYMRLRRTGSAETTPQRFMDPEESFLNFAVAAEGRECTEWTGALSHGGYGLLQGGAAHRYAWERVNRPIPHGMFIDHMCFNRACVNVEHLRLVTVKQNAENLSGLTSRNKSGYRGVQWHKGAGKWVARVRHNGKDIHLGTFDDPVEAARAAKLKRLELFTHNNLDRV